MEQFHVISLLGSDARFYSQSSNLDKARRQLNRNTARLHFRHMLAWLLRGALVYGFFLLGQSVVQGAIGGAIGWTSAFLGVSIFLYAAKGHLKIQNSRHAKLYWLENDAANREFCSNDPIVATMPLQESYETEHLYGKTAS